jgi:hypothetical protein
MLEITRDMADLGDVPFITFIVYHPNGDKTTVCGFHLSKPQQAGRDVGSCCTPSRLPVAQAFEEACCFAESQGIPVIWIYDPNCLF